MRSAKSSCSPVDCASAGNTARQTNWRGSWKPLNSRRFAANGRTTAPTLELRPWLRRKLYYADRLGLRTSAPQSILDLGCGAGYFPWICRRLGHRVQGLDLDTQGMFNALVEYLRLPRQTWRIQAHERLPDFEQRFDLITAFEICFNNHGRPDLWGPEAWEFFLRDLVEHQLSPQGRVYFTLNREPHGILFPPGVRELFVRYGAQIDGEEVDFPEGVLPAKIRATSAVTAS